MGKVDKEKQIVVTTTMSKAYQITVPSVIRKALGLMPGDLVDFKIDRGQAVLVRAETHEEKIKRAFAKLDKIREAEFKRMTPEQKKRVEMSKGWTINQYHAYIDSLPETRSYVEKKYGI